MLSGRLAQLPSYRHLPSSSASSYAGISQPKPATWHMGKNKIPNIKTECRNGSQHSRCIPNAHLTFEYSLKAIFTQLFTAKSKYTQKKFFFSYICIYIKPRNAMPPVWAWTQKALFTCFCLFPTVLYCNCVKLKYAPCCVSSSCPSDLISEGNHQAWWQTGQQQQKAQWICPPSGVWVKFVYPCWECKVFVLPPHPTTTCLPHPPTSPTTITHSQTACTACVSVHTKKQQQVLLVKKKQRYPTRPGP